MRIIISPAKKMNVDTDSFPVYALPQFLGHTKRLLSALHALSNEQLQSLWKCNDAIAKVNVERLQTMDLKHHLTPAILSGFYGLLRPFDGVRPYRLEMQVKLPVDGCMDLYEFWGEELAKQLAFATDVLVYLAS